MDNYPKVTYKRPSGTTISVRDTDGNKEQAAALGWIKEGAKTSTAQTPKQKLVAELESLVPEVDVTGMTSKDIEAAIEDAKGA